MKVAVCISGQPRSFRTGFEYLKRNLLDHYDCRVFIHTWLNTVYLSEDVANLYDEYLEGFSAEIYPVSLDDLNARYTNTPDAINFPAANAALSYYSIFKACELKRKHELLHGAFDVVVKTRFDYALNRTLPLNEIDPNKVYIPNCRMVPNRDFGNDQFAFGSSWVMDRYLSTYLFMDDYYKLGVQMNGEEMLRATLRHHGLFGNNLEYIDMNNPFLPGPYNGTPHSLIRDDMHLWKNA